MTRLVIDKRELEIEEGTVLLDACLRNGIYVPNLCHVEGMEHPDASCRLCFVEVEGEVVPACTVKVSAPVTVRTDTPAVRDLQRSALRLLLSVHEVDCARCPANKKCALQDIARFLGMGLRPRGLEKLLKQPGVVREHPLIDYYPNRCVLCGRCVNVCRTREGRPQMNFAGRGFDTLISFYGANEEAAPTCEECSTCVQVCPVGALVVRTSPA